MKIGTAVALLLGCSQTTEIAEGPTPVGETTSTTEALKFNEETAVTDLSDRVETSPDVSVMESITSLWSLYQNGLFDQAEFASARCQRIPDFPVQLVSEMKNLVAALEEQFAPFQEIEISVLTVTYSDEHSAEATTQLVVNDSPITAPGTQDLVFENGRWRADNCDERELRISHECAIAFGEEHRSQCLPFWHDVIRPSGCDLENSGFVEDFAAVVFETPDLLSPEEWAHFVQTCHLPDEHLLSHRTQVSEQSS